MTTVTLGIVPLTDAALPAVVAAKGFDRAEGIRVELAVEFSWAAIRDKVCFGALDAAHMLAGIPLAATVGADQIEIPMVAPMALGLNGNAITVSNALFSAMSDADPAAMADPRRLSARALAKVVRARRDAGLPMLRFAMVFPFSCHNYELRFWLASAGIDPDRDVSIVVVPPPKTAEFLEQGMIDGYCVGEPWNIMAAWRGVGHIVTTKYDIWNNSPEKVLGLCQSWAESNRGAVEALVRALYAASRWADAPENRREVAAILSRTGVPNVPEEVLAISLCDDWPDEVAARGLPCPDYHVFHRFAATFPWQSHARWILAQMQRWGQVPASVDVADVARRVYRPDIYRDALAPLPVAVPDIDDKAEGTHPEAYEIETGRGQLLLGPDRFFDGTRFD